MMIMMRMAFGDGDDDGTLVVERIVAVANWQLCFVSIYTMVSLSV